MQLKEEIDELAKLDGIAKLESIKTYLKAESDRLKTRKVFIEKELTKAANVASESELGQILVTNYMWDQTKSYLKIYIEVGKEQKIEESQLKLKFNSDREFTCIFGKYRFTLANLYSSVNGEKSGVKITKSNRVIITLYKLKEEDWPSLHRQANKMEDLARDDPKDLEQDPSAGLMKLMKKMYDEGDDEMKKSIAKTWYESSNRMGGAAPTPEL